MVLKQINKIRNVCGLPMVMGTATKPDTYDNLPTYGELVAGLRNLLNSLPSNVLDSDTDEFMRRALKLRNAKIRAITLLARIPSTRN